MKENEWVYFPFSAPISQLCQDTGIYQPTIPVPHPLSFQSVPEQRRGTGTEPEGGTVSDMWHQIKTRIFPPQR